LGGFVEVLNLVGLCFNAFLDPSTGILLELRELILLGSDEQKRLFVQQITSVRVRVRLSVDVGEQCHHGFWIVSVELYFLRGTFLSND
jgi:hypothetical protein